MKKYNTIIFDLDGTLLDTLEDLTDSVNHVLKEHGFPLRTLEEIRSFVGNGLFRLMELAVPDGQPTPGFDEAYQELLHYYKLHSNEKTKAYNGTIALLKELKRRGIKVAIVSNKGDFAVKDLREIYFKDVVEVALGEKEGIRKKPAPDMVEQALKELNVEKDYAVYVGDSEVDLATAKNSKLDCISVTWGFRDKAFLCDKGAEHFVDKPEEILQFV